MQRNPASNISYEKMCPRRPEDELTTHRPAIDSSTVLVYDDDMAGHVLGEHHPFKPIRLRHTYRLMKAVGLLAPHLVRVVPPRPAEPDELHRFHLPEYVTAVRAIGAGLAAGNIGVYGFGPGDNPPYPGIYHANALAVGGTLVAAEMLAAGEASTAFAIAGGLHHAMPMRASGFCVFNDPVIAIMWLVEQGYRVAYVDIDCHHGDGVQHGFYDTDAVLTISIHESGEYLFPGTGFPRDSGEGEGRGCSVNVPLAPFTDDETYLETFDAVVPPLIRAFKPDILFTQLGADTHFRDPITHLYLTTQGFTETVRRLGALAGETGGKWLATGGGGYDLPAVARCWTMALAVMAGFDLPERIPETYESLPTPSTFADPDAPTAARLLSRDFRDYARRSVDEIRDKIFPRHNL